MIDVSPDRVLINFHNGQDYFSEFKIESVEQAAAPIAHTLQTRTAEPTCFEGGYTETYCTECYAVTARFDIKPMLEHKLDGEPQIIAPTCNNGGYTTQHCSVCGAGAPVKGSETMPVGHSFDANGHCTRDGCKGIKGDGVTTTYHLQAPTGEILTLFVAWQGFSTEYGDFQATIIVSFEYGGLIFDGEGIDVYRMNKDGNELDVTAKGNKIYATFKPANGDMFNFEPIPAN